VQQWTPEEIEAARAERKAKKKEKRERQKQEKLAADAAGQETTPDSSSGGAADELQAGVHSNTADHSESGHSHARTQDEPSGGGGGTGTSTNRDQVAEASCEGTSRIAAAAAIAGGRKRGALRTCSACASSKGTSHFTKSQWSKPDAKRRCRPCSNPAAKAKIDASNNLALQMQVRAVTERTAQRATEAAAGAFAETHFPKREFLNKSSSKIAPAIGRWSVRVITVAGDSVVVKGLTKELDFHGYSALCQSVVKCIPTYADCCWQELYVVEMATACMHEGCVARFTTATNSPTACQHVPTAGASGARRSHRPVQAADSRDIADVADSTEDRTATVPVLARRRWRRSGSPPPRGARRVRPSNPRFPRPPGEGGGRAAAQPPAPPRRDGRGGMRVETMATMATMETTADDGVIEIDAEATWTTADDGVIEMNAEAMLTTGDQLIDAEAITAAYEALCGNAHAACPPAVEVRCHWEGHHVSFCEASGLPPGVVPDGAAIATALAKGEDASHAALERFTLAEIAESLGVSTDSAKELVRKGKVPRELVIADGSGEKGRNVSAREAAAAAAVAMLTAANILKLERDAEVAALISQSPAVSHMLATLRQLHCGTPEPAPSPAISSNLVQTTVMRLMLCDRDVIETFLAMCRSKVAFFDLDREAVAQHRLRATVLLRVGAQITVFVRDQRSKAPISLELATRWGR
jgi:hypothetical protein